MDDKNIRLIDANALVADYRICGGCKNFKNCDGHVVMCDSARVRQAINDAPTIEAQPVKHGAWIYGEEEWGRDGIFCNRCGRFVPKDYEIYDKSDDLISDFKYCPSCGARMEGDANG